VNSSSWSEFEKAFFAARWGISQDSDGWEVYGFSLDEAIEWASLDVEPGDANRYRESGVPNPPDENYSFNGIEIEEAIQWVKEGFEYFDDAAEWIAWGVSPKDASKYIDAGKKLPEDEFRFEGLVLEEAIQWVKEGFEYFDDAAEWIAWGVSPKDAKKYKDAGKELPDENFRDEGLTLEETFKWFDEGIEDFYVAAEWIAWKVSPKMAKKYRDAGKEPPDYEFRDEGLSFTNAMKWQEHGFHSSEYDDPKSEDENYWKNWHDAGFKPIEAASMRAKLFEYIKQQFDAGTRVRERQYRFGVSKETELTRFTSQCCQSLMQLAAAGMKIDVENLVKWRGFSSEMIIATIDNGLEPDDADLARVLNIHPNQLELFEKVKAVEDIFMDSNYAKFLLNAGITEKQFQYLLKKGFRLTRIADAIKIHSLTINTIIKWAKAGWPVDVLEKDKNGHQQSVLGPWIETKLDPGTAYLWKMNDFSADDCEKWIKAGITDPEIANRRKVAGIEPKS
jgi:hypothetical protein